jgi:hypothetical protein
MAKTGVLLKKQLGLENLKEVRVSRFMVSAYKILGVFYDSNRDMMVTNYRIRRYPRVATVFHGTDIYHGTDKYIPMTPAIDIEDYNGAIRGALVIPVDLAGDRYIDDGEFTKVFESRDKDKRWGEIFIPAGSYKRLEEITLYDLADAGNISQFTKRYRQSRTRKMGGNEAQQAKLVDLVIDEANNSITFQFLTEVTPYPEDPDHEWFEADPEADWRLKRNRSKVYEIQIQILNFFDWLDTFEGEEITQKEIKEILEVSDVKISSTSPSFNWQGFAYWLTQIDASIYPQNIEPTRWDAYHGDGEAFLDKHTYGIARSIKFFINQMAQKLNSKLQQRGLI